MAIVYHPDAFVNSIKVRKKPQVWNGKEELTFATWKEAHEWLVDNRLLKLRAAEKAVESALRQLVNATKMVDKGFRI